VSCFEGFVGVWELAIFGRDFVEKLGRILRINLAGFADKFLVV
jgi:hypothetical protein